MADHQPADQVPGEAPTVNAPARWSGAAAIPPSVRKRPWWSRRRPASAAAEPTDWAMTPPVDPWADQDTPWDPLPVPSAPPLPPTLQGPPVTPTTREPALPPIPPSKQPKPPPPAKPSPDRKNSANRLPVAPRPTSPIPAPPPGPAPRPGPERRPGPPWRPVAPPPPTAGRRGPVAPPRPVVAPRGRRRWGRRIAVFTLFSVACCCGPPIAYLAWPPARQFPVRAVLPAGIADLSRRDDDASRLAVARLTQQMHAAHSGADQVFAGVYGDGYGKRVTVFGATGFRLTPGLDVRSELNHLATPYTIRNQRSFDLGESGAYERCGVGTASGAPVVVCAWADHGSVAAAVLTRRSITDSARLTGILRNAVLQSG